MKILLPLAALLLSSIPARSQGPAEVPGLSKSFELRLDGQILQGIVLDNTTGNQSPANYSVRSGFGPAASAVLRYYLRDNRWHLTGGLSAWVYGVTQAFSIATSDFEIRYRGQRDIVTLGIPLRAGYSLTKDLDIEAGAVLLANFPSHGGSSSIGASGFGNNGGSFLEISAAGIESNNGSYASLAADVQLSHNLGRRLSVSVRAVSDLRRPPESRAVLEVTTNTGSQRYEATARPRLALLMVGAGVRFR